MKVVIDRAEAKDLADILSLLEVDLPAEGVAEHFGQFFVARDGGRIVGCVGQERYGDISCVRSPSLRIYGELVWARLWLGDCSPRPEL